MTPKQPRPEPVECPRCGQKGNERPGFKLEEFEALEAVFFDTDTPSIGPAVDHVLTGPNLPQKLVCQSCGWAAAVPAGSIVVRKEKSA